MGISRLFISELPIAIEENVSPTDAIVRSWQLTKGYEFKIMAILTVAGIITLPFITLALTPILTAVFFLSGLLITVISGYFEPFSLALFFGLILLSISLFLIIGLFTNPFWQAVKAVVYYDLRTRKEGLGLKIRDRNI